MDVKFIFLDVMSTSAANMIQKGTRTNSPECVRGILALKRGRGAGSATSVEGNTYRTMEKVREKQCRGV